MKKGITLDLDIPIMMDDGLALMANAFLPSGNGKYPALVSIGPYGKDLVFRESYPDEWNYMVHNFPETVEGTSGDYAVFESIDPEIWVKQGYAVLRVDSRGSGRSQGYLDPLSIREALDAYACIEWVARQKWSNGKVGMAGASYYAMIQWSTAALNPPHLSAICPWEGGADLYRDVVYHGGIPCYSFVSMWYSNLVRNPQHGIAKGQPAIKGGHVAGMGVPDEESLENSRVDLVREIKDHKMDDKFYDRSPDLRKIRVPLLSCGNWGSMGLHLRGNTEGFILASSREKWLEIHGGPHWVTFYTRYGRKLMAAFFDHYLKGIDNGWEKTPKVLLWLRHATGDYELRTGNSWPLGGTARLYIGYNSGLYSEAPARDGYAEYRSDSEGITFMTSPLKGPIWILGPVVSDLHVSSSCTDADIFVILRVFQPDMKEVTFYDFLDPHTPAGVGWLRASHRREKRGMTLPWRPYHSHTKIEPLKPGIVYRIRVEVSPTGLLVPRGYRIGLSIRGRDYEYGGGEVKFGRVVMRGTGPFYHEALDRNYTVRVHYGPRMRSCVILPLADNSLRVRNGYGSMVSGYRFPRPF
ncbi:MAG: CocE/NonD family hydrolase [Nitrososphaeria archaeon]